MQAPGAGSVKADINVTPLVDVVLVLLIIFMVVTPLVRLGYTVDVPRQGPTPPSLPTVVLVLEASSCPTGEAGSCRVRIGGETIALESLPDRAAALFENRKGDDRVLFLEADDSLNYEDVLRVVDIAKNAAGSDVRVSIFSPS